MAKGDTNSNCGGVGGGIPPSPCTNIVVVGGNGKATLTWTDPPETETIHGVNIVWKNTTVRYKANSAPTSATDGILVTVETTRNQYQTNALTIEGLTNGTTYYISVFPKSEDGGVNMEASQIVSVIPQTFRVWTVNIDQSNSNPLTCCTYANDAVGMTKGSSEWDEIFGYKPCVMQNGQVLFYLDPNDWNKDENGNDTYNGGSISNIISMYAEASGFDVMIEFPRRGLNITTSGSVISVSLTDNPDNSDFAYMAHKRGSTQKDYFYLGAYDASEGNYEGYNVLCSISGKYGETNEKLTNYFESIGKKKAATKAQGYEIMAFYQWTYIQALYVLKYGNLNSQEALGQGYTDINNSSPIINGTADTKGMNYGGGTTEVVKLFGLENIWGSLDQFIGGICVGSDLKVYTTTDNFGVDITKNWEYNFNISAMFVTSNYPGRVTGETISGFFPYASGASSSTYYCDYCTVSKASALFAIGGGYYNSKYEAGMFRFALNSRSYDASKQQGTRIMYL